MDAGTTRDIRVAFPDAHVRRVKISVGACHLRINPSDVTAWITGTYRGPNSVLPLRVVEEGGTVRIEQEHALAKMINLVRGAPTLDLRHGKAYPYTPTLETGASDSHLDLGGLPLSQVTMNQGAGKCEWRAHVQETG
jgi:hypothetical protein